MQGVNAETVIAAHLMPFKSHAWVEVNGEVVSDSPNVQRYYDVVIERLGTREHIYSEDEE
jgi:3-oxoacyl-ACP reductase-like protein